MCSLPTLRFSFTGECPVNEMDISLLDLKFPEGRDCVLSNFIGIWMAGLVGGC